MSVTYASKRNVASKENPPSNPATTYNTWTRPADWLTLPTVGPTDQKFAGLYAVFDNDANYVAVLATTSTGTYTVDWGDGSSPSTYTSGTVAQYAYNYATVSSGTLTTRGYKQCIITITATTGNLVTVNLNQKYVNTTGYPALPKYNAKWLDVIVGSPNLTSMVVTPNAAVVSAHMLEQFTLVSKSSSWVSFVDLFYFCYGLRKANFDADMSNVTSTSAMFYYCINLEEAPYFDTSSVTSTSYMFAGCTSLKVVPQYNLSNVTNMLYMFNSCSQLIEIPQLDTRKVTDMSYAFQNCYNLASVPYLNTANATTFFRTFEGCKSLTTIPALDTGNVTTFAYAFQNCSSLNSVPVLNTSKSTEFLATFLGCTALETIPTLNTTNANTMFTTFANCSSLTSVPLLDTSNVLTTYQMFVNCTSLTSVPEFNLTKCTNATSMFQSCTSLPTISNINTPNVTNFTSMFLSCTSLESVPAFDTSKGTLMTTMFSGCTDLKSEGLPSFNTANATAMNGMFQSCNGLVSIPTFNTNKVTSFGAMFNGANSLVNIPALNMANATTAAATFAATTNSMGNCAAIGMKFAIDFTSSLMDKTRLETLFVNLGTPASAQTLTITNNPGADTAISKTGTWTTASRNVTITASGSVVAGMYMYSSTAIQAIACSFSTTTSKVTLSAGRLAPKNGTLVAFSNIGTTDLAINTLYYVVNSDWTAGSTFELATTPGGVAIGIGGISSSGTTRYALKVESVVGTTVTLESYPMAAGTSLAVTFRYLNTNLASFRNWTVSG